MRPMIGYSCLALPSPRRGTPTQANIGILRSILSQRGLFHIKAPPPVGALRYIRIPSTLEFLQLPPNPAEIIDLRSDTVTRPSAGMRAAMAAAEVGDDVYGDDPTVNRLEAQAAERFGFASGLFFATGTQSNLAGLMAHCGRGDEYLVGQRPTPTNMNRAAPRCLAASTAAPGERSGWGDIDRQNRQGDQTPGHPFRAHSAPGT